MFVLLAILVAAGALGYWQWTRRDMVVPWRSMIRATPDLADWPKSFVSRIEQRSRQAKSSPADVASLAELTQLYLANGFARQAEQGLRALLRYDPNNARWPHLLAGLLASAGQLEDAVPLWQRAVALAPAYVPAQLKLAEALLKTNRAAEASAVYAQVLTRSPNNAYALLGLGRIEMDAGRWENAKEKFSAATQADPLFSAAHSMLATVASHLGDARTEEAERQKESQLGRYKDAPDPWTDELAQYCYDVYRLQVIAASITSTGGGRAALPVLQRALSLAPDNAQTHRQVGKLYLQVGDYGLARSELERAVELNPKEPAAYLDLVNVYRATKDLPAAFRLLQAGIEQCPQAAGLHFEMGLALIAEGKSEEAITFLQKARELDPENLSAYQQLAVVNFRLGRDAAAVEALTSALGRNPTFGPVLLMLARYRIQSADAAGAEDCLTRARKAGAPDANLEELAQQFYRKFGRAPKLG